MSGIKICIKCEEVKGVNLFEKGRNQCRVCRSNDRIEYREKIKEDQKIKRRLYIESNKELVAKQRKISGKRYKEKYKKEVSLRGRMYYRKNKDKISSRLKAQRNGRKSEIEIQQKEYIARIKHEMPDSYIFRKLRDMVAIKLCELKALPNIHQIMELKRDAMKYRSIGISHDISTNDREVAFVKVKVLNTSVKLMIIEGLNKVETRTT